MLEDHGERAALEERRQRAPAIEGLQRDRQVEQREQLLPREVLVCEEVAAAQAGDAGQLARGRQSGPHVDPP